MIDGKHCLFLHKSYSFAKKRPKNDKKEINFSLFSDDDDGGGGSSFLALHSRGGLYSISISLISVP